MINEDIAQSVNVFGQPLGSCCTSPITGFIETVFVIQELQIMELMLFVQ